ncbi:MAG: DNA-3-methyladenine glycosylase [Acidimicrobiales bacterium]|nr:DNA-3-methyladenine glycosylase [Acidimicrobiales bacterium]
MSGRVAEPVSGRRGRRLSRAFYRRDPLEVAPELLGKVLVHGGRAGRIVEVEAYRGTDDPASHAFRGPTPRTEVMFGPPGHLYVYFTYGMHWCANAVTSEPGEAGAVLLRALEPLRGIEAMRSARPAARRPVDLANGPAKLCQALGIDGSHDGADLVTAAGGITILDDGVAPPAVPLTGPRVGISAAKDHPWRFSIPEHLHRSRPW